MIDKGRAFIHKDEDDRRDEYEAELRAADFIVCRWCGTPTDKDQCPKCKRKVTNDSIEPRREKDLCDILYKEPPIVLPFMDLRQALELLSNGDCAT